MLLQQLVVALIGLACALPVCINSDLQAARPGSGGQAPLMVGQPGRMDGLGHTSAAACGRTLGLACVFAAAIILISSRSGPAQAAGHPGRLIGCRISLIG